MTAVAALPGVRPLPPVLVLAGREGRRIALHPLTLLGLAFWTVGVVNLSGDGPRDAFEIVNAGMTSFIGVPVYFAANLVASRDRRARSGELLAPHPVTERMRLHALLLAAFVPALAALALVQLTFTVQRSLGHFLVEPTFWHLASGPATVLGAALLGIQVSRWFPVPGAAAVVMVAIFAWNVFTSNSGDRWAPLGTFHTWARWDESGRSSVWAGLTPGSPGWHVAYLLGLCAMAATGALLPGAASKRRVLAAGAALTVLTAGFAIAQLP